VRASRSLLLRSPRSALLAAGAALGLVLMPSGAASALPSTQDGVIVYASIRDTGESLPGDPDDFTDLFTVRADGSGFRRLTRTTVWETSPAWAPNHRLIAYSRATPWCHGNTCDWDPGEASIWLMSADGRDRHPLTFGEEDDFIDEYPAWSPDSTKVAFARNSSHDNPQDGIYVVGVDGEGLARLAPARAISLAWSPGGATIAYVHRRGHVELLDVATGRARRLRARGVSRALSVDWSPRGRFLAVASESAVFIVPATGGKARKLVRRGAGSVTWSPDGCCLAFSATRPGVRSPQADLFLVSVRGGRPRRLTSNRGPDFEPDWRR
jgi:Tol biopolymer transport system component